MGVLTSCLGFEECAHSSAFNTARANKAFVALHICAPYGRIGTLVTSRTTKVARLVVLATWCRGGRSPVTGINDFRQTQLGPEISKGDLPAAGYFVDVASTNKHNKFRSRIMGTMDTC